MIDHLTFVKRSIYNIAVKKKNPLAVALGQLRAEKQFAGWTKEQISEHMRKISIQRKRKVIQKDMVDNRPLA